MSDLLNGLPTEPLDITTEDALVKRIRRNKQDEAAVNELVIQSMREAFLYAKRVSRSKIPDDELFSLCYTTLKRNALRFQPGGIRFFAFVKVALRGATKRYWETLDVVRNGKTVFGSDFDWMPHSEPAPAFQSSIDGSYISPHLGDQVIEPNPDFDKPVDPDFKSIHMREMMEVIRPIMKKSLTPQELMIIDLHYNNGFNFQQIGTLLSISRSAAQICHSHALKKIRCILMRKRRLLGV